MADDYPRNVSGMSAIDVSETITGKLLDTLREVYWDRKTHQNSSDPHLEGLIKKAEDPAAGMLFVMISEAIDLLDQYLLPVGKIHKKLLSIYHVANLFVYPLSAFLLGDDPEGFMSTFYTHWCAFYGGYETRRSDTGRLYHMDFALTLSQQTKLLQLQYHQFYTALKDAAWCANESSAIFPAKDQPLLSALYHHHESFTTLLLSVLMTEKAVPKAAMGWSGVDGKTPFSQSKVYHGVNQKDLLADHNAMMIPSKELFEKIYVDQLMKGTLGQQFKCFGRWLK